MSGRRAAAVVVLWMAGSAAVAVAEPRHDRIEQQRAAADAQLAARLRDCAGRFVSAACQETARDEHRKMLADLRQQQLRLDDAERRQAAEARQREIAERLASRREQERRAIAEGATSSPDASTSAGPTRDQRPSPGAIFPSTPRSTPGTNRAASERESQARYAARQREIEAHRAAVEQRQAERAASGKVVAPLPMPGPSAAPGR